MSRTTAYVTTETCRVRAAVRPGYWIGERRVSRHGDWQAWPYAKRETLALASDGQTAYKRGSARAVAQLMGWPVGEERTADPDLVVEFAAAKNLIGED
jgi:hypothetical protein